jgi:DNA (cytosine-5)-methyltransferase 1
MARIPIASFFTGGGFLDMGFEQAGFDIAFTNEFNEHISDMHDHGYTAWRRSVDPEAPEAKITYRGSIEHVNIQMIRQSVGNRPFGIIGGPPCPAFSVAGKQLGEEDPRGMLSRCYAKMICHARPAFFVMENVPGLARTAKHRRYLNELRYEVLRPAGYITDVRILNSLEYGAPQDRERMLMFGVHKDYLRREIIPGLDGSWFPYPEPLYPEAKAAYPWPSTCPFGSTPEKPAVPDELTIMSCLTSLEGVPNATEHFNPKSAKFTVIPEGDVHRKSYKRPHRYRYCPTAAYGNNEVHFHPWLPRRMSVRECLRVQTVPDSYVLPAEKSLSIKFKMIGNGVPVALARAMGSSVMSFLKEYCDA